MFILIFFLALTSSTPSQTTKTHDKAVVEKHHYACNACTRPRYIP